MTSAAHNDAVMALVTPGQEIKLRVRHDPQPAGLRELVITKKVNERMGMSICGGIKSPPGNPLDLTDEGIFISEIHDGGAVKRDGRLKAGMRILEVDRSFDYIFWHSCYLKHFQVNNQSLLGASQAEAAEVLKNSPSQVQLLLCDGYDSDSFDTISAIPTSLTQAAAYAISPQVSSFVQSIWRQETKKFEHFLGAFLVFLSVCFFIVLLSSPIRIFLLYPGWWWF